MNYSIILIDDHPLMRKGLSLTLDVEQDFTVIGQASSAEEGLEMLQKQLPDVVIVDLSLPGMSGLEFLKHAKALYPRLKMIVVSRHDESLYAERAIRAGARGYVMKLEADTTIVEAVRRVIGGGIYVSQDMNERLLMGMFAGNMAPTNSPLEVLSDRELEVFELTGRGITTREIAERLHLSVKTVESYRARIKNKMDLGNATELMQHAVQWVESINAG